MTSPLDWNRLRLWNGSIQTAFEELCCQVARYEEFPQGSEFVRVGPPDGGVEAYWRLPDGSEHGWQAKFFRSAPGDSQWRQMDRSVASALKKYPRLASYTLCLPIDRQGPRLDEQQWFMDRWDRRVAAWSIQAQNAGMDVQFKYWGEHELAARLSRDVHRGRRNFWFNETELSPEWFSTRLEVAIANCRDRYSPDLDLRLPITELFDGLARAPSFFDRLRRLLAPLRAAWSQLEQSADPQLTGLVDRALALAAHVCTTSGALPLPELHDAAEELAEAAYDRAQAAVDEPAEDSKPQYRRHYLSELAYASRTLATFACDVAARLAVRPALLVEGSAGNGKTHLFCSVARQHVNAGRPAVLLLGEQFSDQEPWAQIREQLGLSGTPDEIRGALQAAAQASGERALILVDALNETEPRSMWQKHLAGLLKSAERYPEIGVAVSVRDSYVTEVVPTTLDDASLVRVTHEGFAGHEHQAAARFFDAYGIERPSVPLLHPEFRNPLFLKLLCQGLHARRLHKLPPGLHGLRVVCEFVVDAVDEKLSRADALDYDQADRLARGALMDVARVMASAGQPWLPRSSARALVDHRLPGREFSRSLFRSLLAEGLLAEALRWRGDGDREDVIRFGYERLGDHLIADFLVETHVDEQDPAAAFAADGGLHVYVADEYACRHHQGLIEALSIQLPERFGRELGDLAPHVAGSEPVRLAFVHSVPWRLPEKFSASSRAYLRDYVWASGDSAYAMLDACLTVAIRAEHPYNADWLDGLLRRQSMPQRDGWWSIYLHHRHQAQSPVDVLLEWAWRSPDKSYVTDEVARLAAVALAWFLTTANRPLRDRATKALVALLTDRLGVLRKLLRAFHEIDDLYVTERLYAVAYGCAMGGRDDAALAGLAGDVYELVFAGGEPPPHILLRDYARGVVELALYRGVGVDVDATRIRPPYQSAWPADLSAQGDPHGGAAPGDLPWPADAGARMLHRSVLGFGDFARYVIGTNAGCFDWSSRGLGAAPALSREERFKRFVDSLTPRQAAAWADYQRAHEAVSAYHSIGRELARLLEPEVLDVQVLEQTLRATELRFRRTLRGRKTAAFEGDALPYLEHPHDDGHRFDLGPLQRWVYQRVLHLGWTEDRFGLFDGELGAYSRHDRVAARSERIGKKYQWLAWHEILARVADNFEFRGDRWEEVPNGYQGTWQIGRRDIDPSCLQSGEATDDRESMRSPVRVAYDGWCDVADREQWADDLADLPAVNALVDLTNPDDNSRWLTLEVHPEWAEPVPADRERYQVPHGRIWYQIRAYIVRERDLDGVFAWAAEQDFMGRWMPESAGLHEVFLGELHWSPAFKTLSVRDFDRLDQDDRAASKHPPPAAVLVPVVRYLWERGDYDCSIESPIAIAAPASWLVERLQLRWDGGAGWIDERGRRMAFDPSVSAGGPSALLVRRDALLDLLAREGYAIMWTVLGEKQAIMDDPDETILSGFSGVFRLIDGHLTGRLRRAAELGGNGSDNSD